MKERTLSFVTLDPTRTTTPEQSDPGVNGSLSGVIPKPPSRANVSHGFTPAACTFMRT